MLAREKRQELRKSVASNPRTPTEILQTLARDGSWKVQEAVAANPQASLEILQTLAREKARAIQHAIAANPQTPAELLQTLGQKSTLEIQEVVAANPQAPPEILQAFAQEKSLCKIVAANPQTPLEVLQTLAGHQEANVREAVARNQRVSAEILQILAQDRNGHVRKAVATHPQTPAEVLLLLTQDSVKGVKWMAAFVQELHMYGEIPWRDEDAWTQWKNIMRIRESEVGIEKQLDLVASLQSPDNVRQIVLQALAADWDTASIQVVFALRPGQKYFLASYLPPLALQKLATSPPWEMRFLVAHHAQTPLKIRQLLSRDGNRYVRAMARVKTGMTQP